ncbi:MAG TPA: TIGR04282 family arsenosugar biosynthesis glycosyltransferase [Gemmatimonadota bacterium]|nr:TIGR04282 family arsenosugar biosynthesis glycosyltransferase [Gemmatimonadota bacterium]
MADGKKTGGGAPRGGGRGKGGAGGGTRGRGKPGDRPAKPGDRPRKPGDRPAKPGDRRAKPGDRRAKSGARRAGSREPVAYRPARPPAPRAFVVVFARAPVPGRVKTRLTPALRAQEAADLYRALLLDTMDAVEPAAARTFVAYTPHDARRHLETLLGPRREYMPQGPGDLGARLAHVFGRLADGRRPVLVVGSDCPGLTRARIGEAEDALKRADVVVGPTEDGGYYLIGMKRPHPGLFEDIPWSTAGVAEATRARIAAAGLEARWLQTERDIDTPEDLFEILAGAAAADLRERYPRTSTVLHATLPPHRLSRLEEMIEERRGRR